MTGALDGIRVLELARFQAGPRGGMLLSDLGAEVLRDLLGLDAAAIDALRRDRAVA
jgi:crotonobetainyl-CoA:carnitine CoA-transferase CaiB-like acyl-CoA transferase